MEIVAEGSIHHSRSETYLLCEQLKRLRKASQLASQLLRGVDRPPAPPSPYRFHPKSKPIPPLHGPLPFLGIGFDALSASMEVSMKTQWSDEEKSKEIEDWKQPRGNPYGHVRKNSTSTLPLLPALRRPGYQWARLMAEGGRRGKQRKPLRLGLAAPFGLSAFH